MTINRYEIRKGKKVVEVVGSCGDGTFLLGDKEVDFSQLLAFARSKGCKLTPRYI